MEYDDRCRICLESKGILSFKELTLYQGQALTYGELLADLLKLQLSEKHLPQLLCTTCAQESIHCYEFLAKARNNDAKLRETYKLHSDNGLFKSDEELEAIAFNDQQVANCSSRDPLESEDDAKQELELEFDWLTGSNINDDDGYDEDDNKPLKHLIEAKEHILPDDLLTNVNQSQIVDACADEEGEYITSDNMYDMMSAEEQIFPQGRFKCKICSKPYFTIIGLRAHAEVHFTKKVVAKNKRTRGPNKKKRSTKTNANEDVSNVTEDHANGSIMDKVDAGETTAVETETETNTTSTQVRRKKRPPKPKKVFPCQVCGKQMISASKLRYHMVMHTGEKDYLCTMCPKAYSTIYALKHHIRVHTGERPYECKFCGDRFLRPTTLKSHLRRHTGERPYGCNICGKRFIQHSSMTTHIKLNHMDKNIPCPYCDKKYARQTDLNTHLLSHTGDKPFPCKLCPSRFIRQANLNKHMNQHHYGGEKPNKPSSQSSANNLITEQEQNQPTTTVLNDVEIQEDGTNKSLIGAPLQKDQLLFANGTDFQSWNWSSQS